MIPILKDGDLSVYETDGGRVCILHSTSGKRTDYINAEACWKAMQKMKGRGGI